MANRWGNNGNHERLYFLRLQNHCRWWQIKRNLLLGRKAVTNLDNILESRDITLPTKVYLVKAMVFPVVMYRCESWTIKRAEYQRINTSELWCWRRLLRVPWTARGSNQSILKQINLEYSLKGLMLKLKLHTWATNVKSWLMGKDSELGKTEGQWKRGQQRIRWGDSMAWLNGHEAEQTLGDSKG